jgi:hypothetical protein
MFANSWTIKEHHLKKLKYVSQFHCHVMRTGREHSTDCIVGCLSEGLEKIVWNLYCCENRGKEDYFVWMSLECEFPTHFCTLWFIFFLLRILCMRNFFRKISSRFKSSTCGVFMECREDSGLCFRQCVYKWVYLIKKHSSHPRKFRNCVETYNANFGVEFDDVLRRATD